MTPNKLPEKTRHKVVESLPTFTFWAKDRQKAALSHADLVDLSDNRHVDSAILDLIARHGRKLGWTVTRSTGRDGLKSTVYVTPKGMPKVRVSDHRLPQTHARQLRESMGVRGSWAGEIIIGDVRNYTLEEIVTDVLTLAEEY